VPWNVALVDISRADIFNSILGVSEFQPRIACVGTDSNTDGFMLRNNACTAMFENGTFRPE
jgi:hypothetical protein